MGAWGAGSFENDTALDWAGGVQGIDDVRGIFAQLKSETDVHPDQGAMYVEADFASALIAAAETVAMMLGREIPGFPEELKARLGDGIADSDPLFHQARNAISHVMRNSELAELWDPKIPVAQNAAYIERAREMNKELETALVAHLDQAEDAAVLGPADKPAE